MNYNLIKMRTYIKIENFSTIAGIQRAINVHTVKKVEPTFDSVLEKIKAL